MVSRREEGLHAPAPISLALFLPIGVLSFLVNQVAVPMQRKVSKKSVSKATIHGKEPYFA